MKLKNKKTGEIGYLYANKNENYNVLDENDKVLAVYGTIDDVVAKWEDYEEPKNFWYIDDFTIMCGTEGEYTDTEMASFTKKDIEKLKAIGNYFETKEEAEKTLEKLKAWKWLKDKGFRFDGYDIADRVGGDAICGQVYFKAGSYDKEEIENDLYLLFGGEE